MEPVPPLNRRESNTLLELLFDSFADAVMGENSPRAKAEREDRAVFDQQSKDIQAQRRTHELFSTLIGAANNVVYYAREAVNPDTTNNFFGITEALAQAERLKWQLQFLANVDLIEAFSTLGLPSPFLPGVIPNTSRLPFELTEKIFRDEIARRKASGLIGPNLEDYLALQLQARIARDDAAAAIIAGFIAPAPVGNPNTPPVKPGPGAIAGAFADPIQQALVTTIGEGIAVGGLQYATTTPGTPGPVNPPTGLRPPEAPGTAPGPNGAGNIPRPPGAFPDDIFRANPPDP